MFLGSFAQGDPELRHIGAAQAIKDVFAIASRVDQPGLAQRPEMRAGQAHVDSGLGGPRFNGFLALRKEFKQFPPLRAGQGFTNARDVLVEIGLGWSDFHAINRTNVRFYVKKLSAEPDPPSRKHPPRKGRPQQQGEDRYTCRLSHTGCLAPTNVQR